VRLQLLFARVEGRLLYALEIEDDDTHPATLWSILEREEEKAALAALANGEICEVFLFNELAVNVAWASCSLKMPHKLLEIITDVPVGAVDHSALKLKVWEALGDSHGEIAMSSGRVFITLTNHKKWSSVNSELITSHGGTSPIDLFGKKEGAQQEQLAIWLTDNLDPRGVHASPQVPKGKGTRELTDVILSHLYGVVLIESKALTVLGRDSLPTRSKLARAISGHIEKATRQLQGAIRKLKSGATVSSISGSEIHVERTKPAHAIILIPDMNLIEDRGIFDVHMMQGFMQETGGFIHILDLSELIRIVQAAEIIASRNNLVTPLMAFDFYLIERAKKASEAGTLCIEVLLNYEE
jgi:TusA-related sulfurtransferase